MTTGQAYVLCCAAVAAVWTVAAAIRRHAHRAFARHMARYAPQPAATATTDVEPTRGQPVDWAERRRAA
jgi:hypothetical protein